MSSQNDEESASDCYAIAVKSRDAETNWKLPQILYMQTEQLLLLLPELEQIIDG